ncbi:MAG TPA: serine/threonine-protein kinase [Reyranella sp.]|nr:serine/threonine-protein kinase [Reyranella sp.]
MNDRPPLPINLPLPVGTMVGRFRILEVLGNGGFGFTYRAADERLGSDVAIKEYFPRGIARRISELTVGPAADGLSDDFQFGLSEFLTEARNLRRLCIPSSHPNVVAVYDFIEQHGTGYMIMGFCEGTTLAAHLLSNGPLPEAKLCALLGPLLDGLEHVHGAGLIHRDIKPPNICIGPHFTPVLIDFGTARATLGARTQTMTVMLTPGYAPLEQYSPKGRFGPATDLYALGATLYHAISGTPPPDSPLRVLDDDMVPASAAGKGRYSRKLLDAIGALLELKATKRPQSIADWRPGIREFLPDSSVRTPPPRGNAMPPLNELVSQLNALYSSSRFAEGIELARKARALHGDSPLFLNSEGICLSDLGRHDEALGCFDRALEAAPRWVNLWANKGRALRALGRHGEALACYDKAIECGPDEPTPWANKGNCLLDLYRHREALDCFRRVVELDPAYDGAQRSIERLEKQLKGH